MDKKQLEALLSEIAEWTYPSVSIDNAQERVIPTTGKKEYVAKFTPKPDMGPRIVSFNKNIGIKPCAWCGKIVNQKCSYKKIIVKDKPPIWQCECHTCLRYYDPKTGELTHKNSKKAKAKVAWYNDPNYKG